ncbi:P-loop containing nucleoside triphosphate hydrolase protein [Crucibulum laeve]|uniref:P-loop containing nucleoside triphosphate hydrolase protein n=1 Tax=Crucibulum laeve TaxID=68775 RepID=A0A5C3MLE9_9AGAR|nr:P-loop containing nucleoside triphosphate hydrolase protein [Crucibulum laeve]
MSDMSLSDIESDITSMTISPSQDGSESQGVGLSNPHLAQERRAMLDLVNKLHSTGVQVDIDLPQIAVIGSQSAGKSSLIESISGITLPRAAGTCTRCPTECRLSRSNGPWQCIIALRFITDSKGQVLGQARNEMFGPTIFDKAQVEERIRRAQRAILNPAKLAKDFLTGEDEDLQSPSELSFSTNCVSLQITGPEVADLSFCDLPGLIASVSREGRESDIKLVESLVTSYIRKPSCIILLTVACETDFENQGAHRLAKQYDPQGKRTIGVLTKPDRIPTGEESNWLPFIRNEKESLENNWYCVKQPGSSDIKQGITWAQARTREDEFFSMTPPWSELEGIYQKYLRTSNLVDRLSSILSDLISKRLPEIQQELEKSIHQAHTALNQLPKEPSKQPMNEILDLLHTFVNDLTAHVEGIPDRDGLIQRIRPAQQKFRATIRATAPNFKPIERKYAGKKKLPRARFLANEEEDGVFESEEEEEDYGSSHGPGLAEAHSGTKRKRDAGPIYVDEVMARAHQARTRELPGNFPFIVQKTYIDQFLSEWRSPALILCKAIHAEIAAHIKTLTKKHFSSFGQGGLEQRVNVLLQAHVNGCLQRTEAQINWLLDIENRPFSLNSHYLSDYKDKFLSLFKGTRREDRCSDLNAAISAYSPPPLIATRSGVPVQPQPQQTGIAKILSGLVEVGMLGIKPEDLPKLLPSDPMEPALVIMADVRAYFQVAYKRFADNVPLAVDHELVLGAERGVLKILYGGLGINGPDGHRICKDLAQESPQNADRREELMKKLERLNVASQELLRL